MTVINSLLSALIFEFADDHVGLWAVVKQVRRAFPDDPPEVIRTKTLAMIRFLLEVGSIQAGFPTADGRGFDAWPIDPSDIVARIGSEWVDPKSPPRIGEVARFTTLEARSIEPAGAP